MEIISLRALMEDLQHIGWEGYLCLVPLGGSMYKLWVGK